MAKKIWGMVVVLAATRALCSCVSTPEGEVARSTAQALTAPFNGVLTQHNDLNRSGANLSETTLTTANVNTATFGWLADYPVTGQVYAQPLYVPKGTYNGVALTQNIVIIATQANNVYAFNADPPWTQLWAKNLGAPGSPPSGCVNTTPNIGIGSTPVIDPTTGTIYVVAKTTQPGPVGTTYMLHALDLMTRAEKFGGPVDMAGVSAPGTAADAMGTGKVTFKAEVYQNRVALTLSQGVISVGFASHCDGQFDVVVPRIYHGWVLRHEAATLKAMTPYLVTPNTSEGGFWQGGGGFAVDASGALYMVSGNGASTATDTSGHELANAVIKARVPSDRR